MHNDIKLPSDVAAKLAEIAVVNEIDARTLERVMAIYGDGETDDIMDDGTVWEWTVNLDHSHVARLIANLRMVGKFVDWLSQFKAGADE